MSHPDRPEVRRPSLFFRQPNRAEPSSHKMGWMNVFAWKGELLEALNNSVFVTDGASVGEHLQACLMDSPCQKPKKLNPIIHIVIRSVETLQPVASLVSAVIIWHRCPLLCHYYEFHFDLWGGVLLFDFGNTDAFRLLSFDF